MGKELLLTIDVEDWFQVENLNEAVRFEDWEKYEIRVVDNINKLLALFRKSSVKCTFFVLGWIAEKLPGIIREIHKNGHEIANHGYFHKLIFTQSHEEFEYDIAKSKAILEDIIGEEVIGYRAPSFSITDWAVGLLKKNGFIYDSSYCPTFLHNRYGKINIKRNSISKNTNKIFRFPNGLIEVPLPTIKFMNISVPWGGGAYFRLMPYKIFRIGIKRVLNQKGVYTFYFHPWEIDYKQPRVKNIKLNYKIRHYRGLKNAYHKLEKLFKEFSFTSIKSYLERIIGGI